MTLKTLQDNLWLMKYSIFTLFILFFFLSFTNHSNAKNEYLNDGSYACERGSFEPYTEVRQREFKTGTSDEYQDQIVGFRFRMPIGATCDDDYIAEQQKKQKLKTQLELIKECKRIPKISPPPVEFAELFNMCNKLGVAGVIINKKPEGNHWDNLKIQYLKDNPDIVIMEQAIPNEKLK
jgi:hypothetical protein